MIYYWRSMIFLLKEAGDKTFMKYIDPTKSWGLPKARQECEEKLDNMKIRMLSIQYFLSICKEHIENKMHLGQIQQMIVYLEKLVDGSTVQPTTEDCKTRKAKPVSLCLLNSYLGPHLNSTEMCGPYLAIAKFWPSRILFGSRFQGCLWTQWRINLLWNKLFIVSFKI